MVVGKITGSIVSTRKLDSLVGAKLMVVSLPKEESVIAIDTLGAGVGETVLVTLGDSARFGWRNFEAPIDAVIVGIVDNA